MGRHLLGPPRRDNPPALVPALLTQVDDPDGPASDSLFDIGRPLCRFSAEPFNRVAKDNLQSTGIEKPLQGLFGDLLG